MRQPRASTLCILVLSVCASCDNTSQSTPLVRPQSVGVDAATHPESDASAVDPHADASLVDAGSASDSGLRAECAHPPAPPISPDALAVCPGCGGGARCVPKVLVADKAPDLVKRLAACDADSVCIPDPIIASVGFYKPETCRSIDGAEGRCLSECLPAVASQRDILPQDQCAKFERCVPCFDPLHGDDTGACRMTCDPGPTEPAHALASCCGGAGLCVPQTLVPSDQQSMLSADTCSAADHLCTPVMFTDTKARPAHCASIAGGEGRCLPTCLPSVAAQAARLPSAGCEQGEVCAPCTDPFTGQDTAVCRLHGDAPSAPPFVFETCCGTAGACVPTSLMGVSEQSVLPRDSCSGGDTLCAPRAFIDDSFVPSSCRSFANAEGRCVPACMLSQSQAAQSVDLPQDSCASGELCAPCFNPIDGTQTGVCTLHGDQAKEAPVRFDTACCGQSGLCIPSELAGANADMLPADSCAASQGDGWLCAPKSVVQDPSNADNPFASCKVKLGFFSVGHGKCVPRCMVDSAGWVGTLLQRSNCQSGELCVPCSLAKVPGC